MQDETICLDAREIDMGILWDLAAKEADQLIEGFVKNEVGAI